MENIKKNSCSLPLVCNDSVLAGSFLAMPSPREEMHMSCVNSHDHACTLAFIARVPVYVHTWLCAGGHERIQSGCSAVNLNLSRGQRWHHNYLTRLHLSETHGLTPPSTDTLIGSWIGKFLSFWCRPNSTYVCMPDLLLFVGFSCLWDLDFQHLAFGPVCFVGFVRIYSIKVIFKPRYAFAQCHSFCTEGQCMFLVTWKKMQCCGVVKYYYGRKTLTEYA